MEEELNKVNKVNKEVKKNGGARPGSGRKTGSKLPTTLKREEMREVMRLIYAKHMEEMLLAQIQAAKGYALIDKSDKDGEMTYDVGPNPHAWKNVTDHCLGKPPDNFDPNTESQQLFKVIIKRAGEPDPE